MTTLDSTGVPPAPTRFRFVITHTPMRLSPVPLKSSELRKYSAAGLLVVRAGCGASVSWPSIVRWANCTKCGLAAPATRSDLSMTHISAPLNSGPRMENSSAVTYRLVWSIPSLGWSPKHGQPFPPGSVVSIEYSFHSPRGSGLCRTAMSSEDAVDESLMNKMVANQVWVEGSNQQRGSLVNSLPPTLDRSLMLNGPRSDFPVVR